MVVLKNRIIVFTFTLAPQQLKVFQTCDNIRGLCALCPDSENAMLVFPGRDTGACDSSSLVTDPPPLFNFFFCCMLLALDKERPTFELRRLLGSHART